MTRRQLREGNTVEISLSTCRQSFEATVTGFEPDGWVRILPKAKWPTWRRVRLTDIRKRIDPPMRRQRRAAV